MTAVTYPAKNNKVRWSRCHTFPLSLTNSVTKWLCVLLPPPRALHQIMPGGIKSQVYALREHNQSSACLLQRKHA